MKYLVFLFGLAFFASCEVIENPIEMVVQNNGPISGDTTYSNSNNGSRYVLIEEFTGHKCTNCPEGTLEVERIDSIYGSKLLAVGIHAGVFAEPNTSGMYSEDFRTLEGGEYYDFFAVWGNPSAMINRSKIGGNYVLVKGAWEQKAADMINQQAIANIDIVNVYQDSTRALKTSVTIHWLSSTGNSYNVQLYLVEDSVENWQLNAGVDVPNYQHRHVLRKVLNYTWGETLALPTLGQSEQKSHTITIPSAWDVEKCAIVAFIYNSTTYEIMQANQAHIWDH